EGRQPERRQQHHLTLRAVEVRPVDVAPDVVGHRLLRPLPRLQGLGEELELARRRRESEMAPTVDLDADRLAGLRDHVRDRIDGRAVEVFRSERLLVSPVDAILDQERAVLAHVLERRQLLLRRGFWQAGHAVLEDPAVLLLDAELLARAIRRLEVLPDAERAVRIDPPGELDPELVLLPHLPEARGLVRLPRAVEALTRLLQGDPQHRLAEADPARGVAPLRHAVVA